jgi:simple sugar transport system permease protein
MDIAFWVGTLSALLAATWRLATPLIYASVGETFAERAGVLNIGLEGIMLCGGLTGFLAAYYSGSLTVGVLATLGIGLVLGLLFAFFTVTLKANQIVVGTALNVAGLGITGFIIRSLNSGNALIGLDHPFPVLALPVVSK